MKRQDLFNFIAKYDRRGNPDLWVQHAEIDNQSLFAVTICIESAQFGEVSGSSVALTESEGIDKSLFELVERLAIKRKLYELTKITEFKPVSILRRLCASKAFSKKLLEYESSWLLSNTTSGCAIHSNPRMSLSNALTELIERHTILAAQIQRIPGALIYGPKKFTREDISGIMRCFMWQGPLNTYVAMSEIRKEDQPNCIFGFGAHTNKYAALKKAKLEGILVSSNLNKDCLDAANGVIFDIMRWHYNNISQSNRFYESSTTQAEPPKIDADIGLDNFFFARVLVEPGFYLSRVISPSVQIIHTRLWEKEFINPRYRKLIEDLSMEKPYAY